MKKLLPALIIASLSLNATANVGDLYVQGSVGTAKLNVKDQEQKEKDTTTAFSVAVGTDVGVARYALDYTHFGEFEHTETGFDVPEDYSKTAIEVQSLGVSAFYDFAPLAGFTPYVGARVGVNQLNLNTNDRATAGEVYYSSASDKKTQVGVGAVVGVSYAFNPQWAIDGNVEYNHLGKVSDFKVNEYGAKIGVRYSF